MMRNAIQYDDLLGIPHSPGAYDLDSGFLDCLGVSAEILRRRYGPVAAKDLLDLLALRSAKSWVPVETFADARVGDIVVSEVPRKDGEEGSDLHVSALVGVAPAVALTCAYAQGVMAVAGHSISNVVGIYRWPGAKPTP